MEAAGWLLTEAPAATCRQEASAGATALSAAQAHRTPPLVLLATGLSQATAHVRGFSYATSGASCSVSQAQHEGLARPHLACLAGFPAANPLQCMQRPLLLSG